MGRDGTGCFCSDFTSCFGIIDFLFATLAAAELGFINNCAGSFGFGFGSRLSIGFLGNDCDPGVAFGVEEVEALGGDCSFLIDDRFGGASSTTLNNSRSSSALRSRSTSSSFFVGDTDVEGAARAAVREGMR